MKRLFFKLLLLSIVISCSKSSDDNGGGNNSNSSDISLVSALDAGNRSNASDIFVKVSGVASSLPDKVRIILVPLAQVGSFDLDTGLTLSSVSYHEAQLNNPILITQLTSNLMDSNGDEIEFGIQYSVRLLVYNGSEVNLSNKTANIALSNDSPLVGRYAGTWNDNLYTDYPNSFEILSANETTASGVLYYSGSFSPCCGNTQNDGTINLNFNLATGVISNFTYNQVLANYLGGECNATYSGSGMIDGLNMTINLTGTDCEGPHGAITIESNRVF